MTTDDLEALRENVDKHVRLTCVSGEEIDGELVEAVEEGVSIDIDAASDHPMAGTLLFILIAEIASVRVTSRPLFNYFR